MKIHKREAITRQAESDFITVWIDICKKHELTSVEALQILNRQISLELKYCLRDERHGDPNKPAGLE